MTAVWIRFGAELRSRRKAWLVLALAAGTACGLVVALAAASERTATAYHRFVSATNSADAYVDPGFAFGGDESLEFERVERLPQVEAAEQTAMLAVIARSRTGRTLFPVGPGAVQFNAPTDGRARDTIDRQKVLRGRLPDQRRPDEAVLDSKAARAFAADVGDALTFRVLSHDTLWQDEPWRLNVDPRAAGGGPLVTVRVVGVSANARSNVDAGIVHLSPAFYHAHGGPALGAWLLELETKLEHGAADLRAFEAGVRRIAGKRPFGFFEPTEARTQIQRSVDLLARALRILTAIAAVAALLLVGQALVRQAGLDAADLPVLRALGLTRGSLLGLAAARATVVALPAAALTVLVAFAASPLAPIGWARELEPDPGFAFNGPTLAIGAVVTLLVLLLVGMLAGAWAIRGARARGASAGPVALAPALAALRPPAAAGVRMALLRRGPASPVRSTLAAAVLAVAVAATALTFVESLQHLLDSPRLFGRTWDFEMAGGGPPLERAFVDKLVSDRGVAGVATGAIGPVKVGGRTTGANAMDPVKGTVPPTVLEGRAPRAPDEILLGTKLAGALRLQLGDRVAVGSGRRTLRLRLVGLGVVPDTKWGKLGEGAAMRFAALHRIQPEVPANAAEIVLAPGADRAATLARLRAHADGPSTAVTPAEVADFGGVRSLPLLIAGLFAIAAAAALAHALLTSIRRRRRDLAVLKTLGFTRGQVIETIAWQATTIAAIGVLAGLPLGVGVGRFAWHLFATDLGVVPEAVTALGATALVVPAAILIANLVAALPATTAARTQPARVLRAE